MSVMHPSTHHDDMIFRFTVLVSDGSLPTHNPPIPGTSTVTVLSLDETFTLMSYHHNLPFIDTDLRRVISNDVFSELETADDTRDIYHDVLLTSDAQIRHLPRCLFNPETSTSMFSTTGGIYQDVSRTKTFI